MKFCPPGSALILSLSIAAISCCTGCSVHRLAADQTAEIAEAGALGFNGFWDYEIFGKAVPTAMLQSEALIRISPKNEKLLLGLARTYVVYAYGWIGDEWEIADERGEFERADRLERRIMNLYGRASQLALKVMRQRDDDGLLDQKLKTGKVDIVRAYLREVYKDQEDVPSLYWAGLAWGSKMANSGGDLNQLADAPIARAILERSV
ncbi:MAG TPA: TRAP transporter TatT component family protein, partial [Polyangiaceae bacterium]|nr:TRAP transporter TatT component family protein [Polyangiaceae bacterium]